MNDELKDEKDKFLRLFAEFENFRKRTAKERLDLFKSASSELMTALIPVADEIWTEPLLNLKSQKTKI